jgi:hypothetical protein
MGKDRAIKGGIQGKAYVDLCVTAIKKKQRDQSPSVCQNDQPKNHKLFGNLVFYVRQLSLQSQRFKDAGLHAPNY